MLSVTVFVVALITDTVPEPEFATYMVFPIEGGGDILRLEDLIVTNGPDLYVYLSTDKSASDFVNLGRLKANIGNQNYPIPAGTDMTKYDTVLISVERFLCNSVVLN